MTGDCDLKDDKPDNDAIADHYPTSAGGVLSVVHGIEQLVLVDIKADDKVDDAWKEDLPRSSEHAVDDTDEEY